jgi:DNA-binding transcriptional regulator YiaG
MEHTTISRSAALARVRRLARSGRARAIRVEAGVSQAEVARDVATSQSALSLWERGRRVPTGDASLRWLAVLDELERV